MFDIISNVASRTVTNQVTLEELVNYIKNPSEIRKGIISKARTLDKKSYDKIKRTLPCFVPNFNHNLYVKGNTRKTSTGYLYIDVDNSLEFVSHESIAARWTSLSGNGLGYLIAVEGLSPVSDPITLKEITKTIADTLGIPFDNKAVSVDRINIISYDEEVYYNPKATKINVSSFYKKEQSFTQSEVTHKPSNSAKNNTIKTETNSKIKSTKINKKEKCSKTPIVNNYIRLGVNEYYSEETMRYSNLEDYTKDYVFEENQEFIYLEDKIAYVEVYIPEKIYNGERNQKLFSIASMMYGLNPNVKKETLYNFAYKLNSSRCEEPVAKSEVTDIVAKILQKKPLLFANKTRRFLFNEAMELTRSQKQSIAGKNTARVRVEETNQKIDEFLNNYDVNKDGRIFMRTIERGTGLSYSTIRRRGETLKDMMKSINSELKKVA